MLVIPLNDGLELWSIFHDELDLDGNGHLDAEELAVALSKAGKTNRFLRGFPSRSFRNNPFAVHPGRLHDISDLVTTFTFDQLSGIQGFLIIVASKGIDSGDIPVLRSQKVHGR